MGNNRIVMVDFYDTVRYNCPYHFYNNKTGMIDLMLCDEGNAGVRACSPESCPQVCKPEEVEE